MTAVFHGFHHTGILTRDLGGLEKTFTSFGFTLSPRSRHLLSSGPGQPPVPGCTANRCALFGNAYIELLGIVDESAPDPWHTKTMADESEGFRLLNLETGDADAAESYLTSLGQGCSGVLSLERAVETEAGMRTMRARTLHLDPAGTPGANIGIAQHLTREYVHQPCYLAHPNTAQKLAAVLLVIGTEAFDTAVSRYTAILGADPLHEGPMVILNAGDDSYLQLLPASDREQVLPGEPVPAASYLAAMTIEVQNIDTAREIVETSGTPIVPTADGFFVSSREAYGAGLFFTG